MSDLIVCRECGCSKPPNCFYNRNKRCKACDIEWQKKYNSNNKEKRRIYMREYNRRNPEKVKKWAKISHEKRKHDPKENERKRAWRLRKVLEKHALI